MCFGAFMGKWNINSVLLWGSQKFSCPPLNQGLDISTSPWEGAKINSPPQNPRPIVTRKCWLFYYNSSLEDTICDISDIAMLYVIISKVKGPFTIINVTFCLLIADKVGPTHPPPSCLLFWCFVTRKKCRKNTNVQVVCYRGFRDRPTHPLVCY